MAKHFSHQLLYTRERVNYARFRLTSEHPADPNPKIYSILAREQGTVVGYEQIIGLLDCFGIDMQVFRDAYNLYYNLNPDVENSTPVVNL
jgi:hypothetical protein